MRHVHWIHLPRIALSVAGLSCLLVGCANVAASTTPSISQQSTKAFVTSDNEHEQWVEQVIVTFNKEITIPNQAWLQEIASRSHTTLTWVSAVSPKSFAIRVHAITSDQLKAAIARLKALPEVKDVDVDERISPQSSKASP